MDELASWLPRAIASHSHLSPSWGDVLDAGTGKGSFRWLSTQPTRSLTAVTFGADTLAEVEAEADVLQQIAPARRRVLRGDWQNTSLLEGELFDVVVCDYLIGSVEHFAPHWQDGMLQRMRNATRPGGLLVLVGRQPLGLAGADNLVQDIERVRDAAMLLSGQRPYRELPVTWATERLTSAGFALLESRHFERRVDGAWLKNELRWSEREAKKVDDAALRAALSGRIADLRRRVTLASTRPRPRHHLLGFDYGLLVRRGGTDAVASAGPPQSEAAGGVNLHADPESPSCRACSRSPLADGPSCRACAERLRRPTTAKAEL